MADIRSEQPTVAELVERSIRLFGGVGRGQAPTADELSDGLHHLNDLIESWNLQKPLIYEVSRQEFTLISKNPHTIGLATGATADGDFAVPRPPKIQSASTLSGTIERSIDILSDSEWQDIRSKGSQGTRPRDLWYEREWPLGKLWLWPAPSAGAKLILNLWKQMPSGLVLTEHFNVPPGYLRALRFNLAVEIASEWGMQPPNHVVRIAKESKAAITSINRNKTSFMRANNALTILVGDAAGGGYYDIESGDYY